MKVENLKVGQTLYDYTIYRRYGDRNDRVFDALKERKAGDVDNRYRPVKIISIDIENKTVEASWNGNHPTTYHEKHLSDFKVKQRVYK